MCVTALAGCGSSGTEEGNSSDAAATDGTEEEPPSAGSDTVVGADDASTVLKWAIWDAKTATYWEAVAQAYVDKNPDVRIEMTDLGSADYQTVLSTELSGSGSDFDVVTIKDVPGYATLVSKGVLEPLTDRIEADGVDLSLYNGMTEQVTVDGELYELPF
ncbi:MAG TPA: extracellular solute-binding protein, partial [Candidatus Mediterraneibacter norfolkensis]|nr:extracellular solute-binding protein [Candidatus Mediterraneibacter norfolkensis]